MYYLVTDQNDQTWREVQWGPDVTHEESQPNHFFSIYEHLATALFMHPAYEGTKNPKIWECSSDSAKKTGFIYECPKLTTHKTIPFTLPTRDQQITFAIICCLQLVQNPIFKKWAIDYLRGIDTTKETAAKVQDVLGAQLGNEDIPPEHEYLSCTPACLAAILVDDSSLFAANAAHRAYYDSPYEKRIELHKLADIALRLSAKQIGDIIQD